MSKPMTTLLLRHFYEDFKNKEPDLTTDQLALRRATWAVYLFSFNSQMRITDILRIRVEDVRSSEEALDITLPHLKTYSSVPGIRAYSEWMQVADIHEGPLFRTFEAGHVGEQTLTTQALHYLLTDHLLEAGECPFDYSLNSFRLARSM
ncbi:hypothetical protein B0H16DRAFT_1482383 [Mycena metata]|uniref:Tyr recombinase domain-containing protein n=1 Tax=Mycena metata TaxID=1033252 RepID=A0AAD7GU28_9AGAR|nr:hypothetical protein B0H16DRAFT_1482383 [Mycena metata]